MTNPNYTKAKMQENKKINQKILRERERERERERTFFFLEGKLYKKIEERMTNL